MKNILLCAPSKVYGIICSYPLIHKIYEYYEDVRIHIIVPEGLEKYYEFFPFHVSLHSFPESKKTFFGVHHYAVNLHDVFNVDVFFDLEGEFYSSLMGKYFSATHRVGFKTKINHLLLTHKVNLGEELLDRKFLMLLEEYEKTQFLDFSLGGNDQQEDSYQNVVPLFKNQVGKSFILVFIDDLKKAKIVWDGIFPLFEHISFIFWGMGDHESNREIVTKYDRERGLFKYTTADHYADLNKLISQSDGIITNQEWMGNLASIKKKKVFSFVEDLKDLKKFRHIFFEGAHIEYAPDSLLKLYGTKGEYLEVRLPCDVTDYIVNLVYPEKEKEIEKEDDKL